MKGKQSWMERLDKKRDAIGEKLSKKEMKLPVDLVTGVFFMLLGAVILMVMPNQVPVSDSDVINGRAFPALLMAVMIACSGAVLAKELYNIGVNKKPPRIKTINLLVEVKALEILAILLLTYAICRATDLFVVGAVFCSLAFLVYFRCRKLSYYGITLTVAVLIWIAFRFGLNVNF